MAKGYAPRRGADAEEETGGRSMPLIVAWVVSLGLVAGAAAFAQFSGPSGGTGHEKPADDSHGAPHEPAKAAAPEKAGLAPVEPGLLEESAYGALPRKEGHKEPWQVYARPSNAPASKPQVAILVFGLGMSEQATANAVRTLDPRISLAYSPYAQKLKGQVETARSYGHEVLAMLPMEPVNYPNADPGPLGLMSGDTAQERLHRLYGVLASTPGGVGVVSNMGSRLTTLDGPMGELMLELSKRGMAYVDARATPYSIGPRMARENNVPRAQSDKLIDEDPDADVIDQQLAALEARAKATGFALGLAQPYPVTYKELKIWTDSLEAKGIELVPVSAVLNKQIIR